MGSAMLSPMGYRLRCTLAYGDIYGQIMVWLLLTFLSLATGAGLGAAGHPIAGIGVIGLILALTLPFLLFLFTTTLISHLVLSPLADHHQEAPSSEIPHS
jgi:hypothetical protein